jgi:hypothetical protein
MKSNLSLSQVCKTPFQRGLLQLIGIAVLGVNFFPIAWAQPAVLDRASSLFPIPLEQSNPWLSQQSAVNGDFGGDNHVDQEHIKFSKDGYEIEVTLRAHPGTEAKIFWPSSEQVGLGLITCDVDQDGDQDLVLINPTSLFPLAVWISDGTGHFQAGDHDYFVPFFPNDNHPTFHPGKKLDKQICFPRHRWNSVDLLMGAYKAVSHEVSTLTDRTSLASLPCPGAFSLPSRSPPRMFSY